MINRVYLAFSWMKSSCDFSRCFLIFSLNHSGFTIIHSSWWIMKRSTTKATRRFFLFATPLPSPLTFFLSDGRGSCGHDPTSVFPFWSIQSSLYRRPSEMRHQRSFICMKIIGNPLITSNIRSWSSWFGSFLRNSWSNLHHYCDLSYQEPHQDCKKKSISSGITVFGFEAPCVSGYPSVKAPKCSIKHWKVLVHKPSGRIPHARRA